MLRKSFLFGALAAMAVAIGAGCYVYYPEDVEGDSGGFAGWDCEIDRDCAAGCYCSDAGYCEEAGFCDVPEDCPDGFTCDDRNSCVPDRSTPCEINEDCDTGAYCNDESTCEDSGTCTGETEDECGEGFECDVERGTCEPAEPVSECLAPADCGVAPECEVGTSAEIVDGCYTGVCIANEECSDGAPCSQLDEPSCDERMDCSKVVNGINCTNGNGDPCDVGDTDCSCEEVVFAECTEAAPDPGT